MKLQAQTVSDKINFDSCIADNKFDLLGIILGGINGTISNIWEDCTDK